MSVVSDNLETLRAYPLSTPGSVAQENVEKLRGLVAPLFAGINALGPMIMVAESTIPTVVADDPIYLTSVTYV